MKQETAQTVATIPAARRKIPHFRLRTNPLTPPEPARRLFGSCCDEWLQVNRLRLKESTYVKYLGMLNNHIKPQLGNLSLGELSSLAVEEFSAYLLHQRLLRPKTVRDVLGLLRSILNYVLRNWPDAMPYVDIYYPKVPKADTRVLSPEEQQRLTRYLLTNMDNGKFGVLLALMTGLRIGEICALRWGDVSLSEGLIHVRSTMQRLQVTEDSPGVSDAAHRTRILIGDPKSTSSKRLIPLTPNASRLCRLRCCNNPAAFVLTGSPDRFMEPRLLQYHLNSYVQACGLSGVHFHTLRHSFATRCVELGFDIKTLSEILGHSNTQITLDRYVHSSLELKRANMAKLSSLGY